MGEKVDDALQLWWTIQTIALLAFVVVSAAILIYFAATDWLNPLCETVCTTANNCWRVCR